MAELDELKLIQEVSRGNTSKYHQLVELHQQMVFRTCMGFVHQKEDAEDITQDVFIKAFESLKSFKGDSSFATWIYRIAINHSLTFLRKKKTQGFVNSFENLFQFGSTDNQTPETSTIDDERRKIIKNAVDSLSENQKIAFTLSKYDELSQAQIAEIMRLSEGAVESLLQRAKKNLQKKLIQCKKNQTQAEGKIR